MDKAIDCHNKAINIDPNCMGSLNGLGLALLIKENLMKQSVIMIKF